MPNLGPLELLVMLLFLTVWLGAIYLIVRVIRLAWDGGQARRVRELEARVRELEQRR